MTRTSKLPDTVSVAERRDDGRMHAPAAERNAEAITNVLTSVGPDSGNALEIASGTGQHVVRFAAAMPNMVWQPSEVDPARQVSIDTWTAGSKNVLPAISLDATCPGWSNHHGAQDLIVVINLLHLISAHHTRQMITEVAKALNPMGRFCIYGPFLRDGVATSDGDARFDASIRAADPDLGYKDNGQVQNWLTGAGLRMIDVVDMPANNLIMIAEKPAESP